jgi:hypothetical protein
MPDPSMPCRRVIPETAFTSISGVAHPQCGRPVAVRYLFGRSTLYAHVYGLCTYPGWLNSDAEDSFKHPWQNLLLSKEQYALKWEGKYLLELGQSLEFLLHVAMQKAGIEALKYTGEWKHGHMARVGHELPKVSLGLAMPYPSTPCGVAILHPFGHPMPYAYASDLFSSPRLLSSLRGDVRGCLASRHSGAEPCDRQSLECLHEPINIGRETTGSCAVIERAGKTTRLSNR